MVRVLIALLFVVLGSRAHGPDHTHSHHHHHDSHTTSVKRDGANKVRSGMTLSYGSFQQEPSFSFTQSRLRGICTSLVRRTVVGQQAVTYPCFRPIPGVVPQFARQSPMGLVCQGLVRAPRAEYMRVPTCCPGWKRSSSGACVKRDEGELIIQKSLQPKIGSTRSRASAITMPPMPSLTPKMPPQIPSILPQQMTASQMADRMSILRNQDMMQQPEQRMVRKRLEDLTPYPSSNAMNNRLRMMSTFRKSPLAKYGNSMAQWAPRAMYLREMQMGLKAAERLIQRRAMMMRNLNRQMMLGRLSFSPPNVFRSIMIPKGLKLLHIIRTVKPKVEKTEKPRIIITKNLEQNTAAPEPFPEIPKREPEVGLPQTNTIMGRLPPGMFLRGFLPSVMSSKGDGPTPIPDISANELRPKPNLDIVRFPTLPRFPIEMPPVQVQPGPNSPFHTPTPPQSCFSEYVKIVKKCLKDANVELPAAQNFLPGKSSYDQGGVCEKKQMITECIVGNLRPCSSFAEQALVRRTLAETLAEMNRDCRLHELESIESRLVGEIQPGPDSVHHKLELLEPLPQPTPADDVTTATPKPEVTTEEPKTPVDDVDDDDDQAQPEDTPDAASAIDTRDPTDPNTLHHTHDIQMEELAPEYYLPVLIGTAIGLASVILLLSALLCICCRRRIKKKVYIERQPEKPKLLDGVYTIGVPPPVYEVTHGIPHISYEEAKGEKITGSPSSLRRHNIENEAYERVDGTNRKGVVSDI
ncbi:uncharacterized protein LOC110452343 isoform X2 [Mizuhopecten yessoensis]|uniref:uncharacterized protein LOC110452343 isoform X2 n=1 Tax=Mizuhopecten yessoensis TaxID=6573 RepID=UPI000B459D4B|nr:uncharacterized protein LOC110452343 isoform X2 [Mizuhopecten yessoensis]